jgi:Bacterial Ig-like domain/Cellulase (glycosyl hydrolase family 5)
MFLLALLLTACGGGATGGGTSPGAIAPTVSSTSPANHATGVATNATITATFSKPVDASTVTQATFTLNNGVTGTVTYSDTTASFTPSSALANSTQYTATISTGVKSATGTAMASAYAWTFTTGSAADTTPPTVTTTSPANNATGIATNAAITATFSEAMTASTVTTTTFTLKNGATGVAGTVAYSGTTATFTPSSALANSTQYAATISTGVKDLAGNAMTNAKTWSFTTSTAVDTTPPTVTATSPTTGATGVSTNAAITATFSEALTASTVTNSTFTLMNGSTSVPGTVNYSGITATFAPSSALAASTQYTATISTGIQDLAGNAMASAKTWSFTTGNGTVSTNGWLYTKSNDNKIYVNDGSGEQVWVGRGVNVDDMFLGGYNGSLWMATADAEQALKDSMSSLVSQWKPNFVRVNLGMNSYTTVSWLANPAQYRTPMENVINALGAEANVYVLVTLRSDTSMNTCKVWTGSYYDDARCFPTASTDAVYQALVDSFADKPYVLFGVSNEPGGMDNTDAQLRAAMSHAVDVIRAREDALGVPHHIVVVQGNNWTSRLDFYSTTPLTQDNVVYEYHSYPPVAAGTYGYGYTNIPVIIGEYGGANFSGMTQSQANDFYANVEKNQISNLGWYFSPYSGVLPPMLNVTGNGNDIQPNAWGNIVKSYLLLHAQ